METTYVKVYHHLVPGTEYARRHFLLIFLAFLSSPSHHIYCLMVQVCPAHLLFHASCFIREAYIQRLINIKR